eukprot:jgi/Mesvir1/15607/Mv03215-RA.1
MAEASQSVFRDVRFDNSTLRALPIDPIKENYVRASVRQACFSRVEPAPLENPKLVAASSPALQLIDMDGLESSEEFVEVMAGNKILPGSEPASHCYCGHQFGVFAGQLGDGAAIYLGEVINRRGERWEIQLKGAGKTPYSRDADGRKVLRSSIREFLASEALNTLGIPTTRAGSIITSDTRVKRDPLYNGNVVHERASVVLRIAPTFLRFGSFEIFKPTDPLTGRRGPSVGLEAEMLPRMLDHIIRSYFSEQSWSKLEDPIARYLAFFEEVVHRTARLVAMWQSVGFCHGVLNTDNMSILGLTLDYGPYGFLDTYNPNFIPNGSDKEGRYDFKGQPAICRWNCLKFAEALRGVLPLDATRPILEGYDTVYAREYLSLMRRKLGLLRAVTQAEEQRDRELVTELLRTMEKTAADFTNTFRLLKLIRLEKRFSGDSSVNSARGAVNGSYVLGEEGQPTSEGEAGGREDKGRGGRPGSESDEVFLEAVPRVLADPKTAALVHKPAMDRDQLVMFMQIAETQPQLLGLVGMTPQRLREEVEKFEAFKRMGQRKPEEKAVDDKRHWRVWLDKYRARLCREVADIASEDQLRVAQAERDAVMSKSNPRVVLRNYLAHTAIQKAEEGDYTEVRQLLAALLDPFSDGDPLDANKTSGADEAAALQQFGPFAACPPPWAAELCVTCSS